MFRFQFRKNFPIHDCSSADTIFVTTELNPLSISPQMLNIAGSNCRFVISLCCFLPSPLGHFVPAGTHSVKTTFSLPLVAGNEKSLTAPYPCPGAASAPAGGGRCPRWISLGTASSNRKRKNSRRLVKVKWLCQTIRV